MLDFIVYDLATGYIKRIGTCEDDYLSSQALDASEVSIAGTADLNADYVVDGVITTRPTQPITVSLDTISANGVATSIISGIVNPSVASFVAPVASDAIPEATITTGTITFSTLIPGDYTITLASFPYLDYVATITAV